MRTNVLFFIAICAAHVTAEEVIVFENVNTVDAVDGLREEVTVVIRGNRIASVEATPSEGGSFDSAARADSI